MAAAFPASSGKGFNQLDLFSHLEQYKKGSSLALEIGASTYATVCWGGYVSAIRSHSAAETFTRTSCDWD